MNIEKRVICWFSCGAASAYASYMANIKYSGNIEAVYCRVREEHPSNLDFIKNYTEKTGIPVKIIGDDSMDYSIFNVFRSRRFIKGRKGAPCTMVLKRWVRENYQRPNDIHVMGYTAEEGHRVDRFIDNNNELDTDFILYDCNVSKNECKQFLLNIGLELPVMYQLGYGNNNCIGCVKGGMGYFNAIRRDFPDHFNRMAKLERELGHAINKDKNGPVFLDELDPNRGNFERDLPGECGFICEGRE